MTAAPTSGSRGRLLPIVGSIGLVVAAAATTWYFTRGEPAVTAAPPGHQHGTAPAGEGARPVWLSEHDQQRIGVTFATAEVVPLERTVRIVAQVTYDETRVVTMTTRVDGFVEKLYANFTGQVVSAGDPMLEFYSPMVAATAEELRVAARLAGDVAGGSEESRASAGRLVQAARERLLSWNVSPRQIAHVEEHGAALRSVVLYAPASGVILQKSVLDGQRIMEGDALFRIADLGVVWIEGEVFEQDLTAARVGQRVQVEFQALPGVTRSGRITYVYPTLSPETRTGRVRVAMPNPGRSLKPGMFATLKFPAATTGPVLSIPRSAVLSTGERNLVFVKNQDGRFTPVDIALGAQTEERVEVRRGLSAGDMVVSSATFLVDAESNLGSLFGGMGNMPGMDMTAPAAPGQHGTDSSPARAVPAPVPAPGPAPGSIPPSSDSAAHQHNHGEN